MIGGCMGVVVVFGVSCRSLRLVTLLVVVLVSSLFVYVVIDSAIGVSLDSAIQVKNEDELKNAINNAPTNRSAVITITNDITLTHCSYTSINSYSSTLIIPANKDITLTGKSENGFYKLIGAVDTCTIVVEGGGVLRLDGVSVTHKNGVTGCGVYIMHGGGMLYLYNGEISGNIADNATFSGGGVIISNSGTFVMSGGKITDNIADKDGGGVDNYGTFIMSGGEISGNTAGSCGGGVHLYYPSNFTMSGGTISGNIANFGGGVSIIYGGFTLSGGTISGNIAFKQGGGVYNAGPDPFVMSDGMISSNSAEEGGGVYHKYDVFTMSGGEITGNTATLGGGVYNNYVFNRQGGVISDNTAANKGNNVYPGDNGNSSDGNDNSPNDGSSYGSSNPSDENGSSSKGDSGQFVWGFGVVDVLVICVVNFVTISVAIFVLFSYFKKR
jgi:hypothetical protein